MSRALLDVAEDMARALQTADCQCRRGDRRFCSRCRALQVWSWWLEDQRDGVFRVLAWETG